MKYFSTVAHAQLASFQKKNKQNVFFLRYNHILTKVVTFFESTSKIMWHWTIFLSQQLKFKTFKFSARKRDCLISFEQKCQSSSNSFL